MLSPLQLRQYLFTEVAIAVVENGSAEGEVTFEQQLRCGSSVDNPLIWRVDLRVTMTSDTEKPFTYFGSISIRGIFEIHPDFPEARREELIRINGASLLFGAIREMVLNITSRSLKGPLVLPTVNFQEAEQENESSGLKKVRKAKKATSRKRTTAGKSG